MTFFITPKPRTQRADCIVAAAIRRRDLPRLNGKVKCVDCGNRATDYDHRDYAKPLEVEPVCHRCNMKRGPGKNKSLAFQKGHMMRVTDATYERLTEWSRSSGRPMNEILETVLRQVKVRTGTARESGARKEARP